MLLKNGKPMCKLENLSMPRNSIGYRFLICTQVILTFGFAEFRRDQDHAGKEKKRRRRQKVSQFSKRKSYRLQALTVDPFVVSYLLHTILVFSAESTMAKSSNISSETSDMYPLGKIFVLQFTVMFSTLSSHQNYVHATVGLHTTGSNGLQDNCQLGLRPFLRPYHFEQFRTSKTDSATQSYSKTLILIFFRHKFPNDLFQFQSFTQKF